MRVESVRVGANDCVNYQHGQAGQCNNEYAAYVSISLDDGTWLAVTVCQECKGARVEHNKGPAALECIWVGTFEQHTEPCNSCGHTRTVWRKPKKA